MIIYKSVSSNKVTVYLTFKLQMIEGVVEKMDQVYNVLCITVCPFNHLLNNSLNVIFWRGLPLLENSKINFVWKRGKFPNYKVQCSLCVAQNSTLCPKIVFTCLVYLHQNKTVPINPQTIKLVIFVTEECFLHGTVWKFM